MSLLINKAVRISVVESLGTVTATIVSVKDGSATVNFSRYGSVYQAIVPLAWIRSKVSGKTSAPVEIKSGAKVLVSMQIDAIARRAGTVVGESDAYLLLQPEAVTAEVKIIPWSRIKDAVIARKPEAEKDAGVAKAPKAKAAPAPAPVAAPAASRRAATAAPAAPARRR